MMKTTESILNPETPIAIAWLLRLSAEASDLDPADFLAFDDAPHIDVRVYVRPDGSIDTAEGDSSYDQDHRGWCGAASVWPGMTEAEASEVWAELVDQIADIEATDRSLAVSNGYDAGNYCNAYECSDLETALGRMEARDAWRSANVAPIHREWYRAAFILGFFASYENHEIPADAFDEFCEAYLSPAGKYCVDAGYCDARDLSAEAEA